MKILIAAHEYPPNITSGSGRYAKNLIDHLVKKGHKITLITSRLKGGEKYERKNNLEIYRLGIFHSKFLEKILPNIMDDRTLFGKQLKKFLKNLNLEQYDIIHIIDKGYAFAAKEIKIPKVVSVNDAYALETPLNPLKAPYFSTDFILRYPYYQLTKIKDKKHLKKFDKIIVNSKYTGKVVSKICNIPKERIKVIYRGINIKHFTTTNKEKYKSKIVLFVGKNMERKGGKYFLKAASLVLKEIPDAKFIIIGKASFLYRRILNRIIDKNKIEKNIEIREFVPPEEIRKYYQEANVFCITSIIEALGQVQLEAMAAKTPVIGSKTGGIPETIKDTGFLVKPKDSKELAEKIILLLKNPKLAEKIGNRGYKKVTKTFNAKKMSEENLKVYKEVTKR